MPHPCLANYIWHGVGHKNVKGGGERNPFGLDFAANSFVSCMQIEELILYILTFCGCIFHI